MSVTDEKVVCCDYGRHAIAADAPRVTLSGSLVNVPEAPGGLTLDFCSWAHAVAWAAEQQEFGQPPP